MKREDNLNEVLLLSGYDNSELELYNYFNNLNKAPMGDIVDELIGSNCSYSEF